MRLLHRIQFLLLLRRQQRTNLRHGVVYDGFAFLHCLFVNRANLRSRLIYDRLDFGLLFRAQIEVFTQPIEDLMPAALTTMVFSGSAGIFRVDSCQRDK